MRVSSRSLGEQHQRCSNWWRPLGEDGKLLPEQAMSAAINNPGFETHFDEKLGPLLRRIAWTTHRKPLQDESDENSIHLARISAQVIEMPR
jgi:hypothetical protein